jgi:serine/threonine-protein kinase
MFDATSWDPFCPTCERAAPGAGAGSACARDGRLLVHRPDLDPRDPDLGRLVAGKYAVVGVLGRGGSGDVYAAVQLPLGRLVALKRVRPALRQESATRARFLREARLLSRLAGRGVAMLLDFGADADGSLYMALERAQGRTLEAVVRDEGPLAPDRVARLLVDVLGALAEAHRAGIVHRDLKPANLMLGRDALGQETVKLLDFGVACGPASEAGDAAGHAAASAPDGLMVGTPSYMAPEQVRGEAPDGRADLYALGCLACFLLTGRPPFDAADPLDLLVKQVEARPPSFDPALGIPAPLQAVVRRAMAKDPADRFADAVAMAAALGATRAPRSPDLSARRRAARAWRGGFRGGRAPGTAPAARRPRRGGGAP